MRNYYGYGLNPAIVGRTLAGVEASEDNEVLTLLYVDGTASRYRAEGECCSSTWIEHLTIPADIEGATITGISEGEYVDGREATAEEREAAGVARGYVDVLQVYQSAIQTDRGEVIIEYRNDSNGYYGGSLRQMADGVSA